MSGATARPWQIRPCSDSDEARDIVSEYVVSPHGIEQANWIAQCDLQEDPEENKANAALIVAAVNSYDAHRQAVEALRDIVAELADAEKWACCIEARDQKQADYRGNAFRSVQKARVQAHLALAAVDEATR